MQNFTGSWARAASQPMPQAGLTPPTAGGPPVMGSSLRPQPNPQAGLNEKPKTSPMNGMLQSFMYQMLGMKPPKPKAQAAAPAAPAARQGQMDRASRLFEIGAGLMD
jgi:hypothetical protein